MAYFLEVIERGSIFLSAAGFVSSIIIHTFFCSLDTYTDANGEVHEHKSGLSFVQRFICHLHGVYDITEIEPKNLASDSEDSNSEDSNSEAVAESSTEIRPAHPGPSFPEFDWFLCQNLVTSGEAETK